MLLNPHVVQSRVSGVYIELMAAGDVTLSAEDMNSLIAVCNCTVTAPLSLQHLRQ